MTQSLILVRACFGATLAYLIKITFSKTSMVLMTSYTIIQLMIRVTIIIGQLAMITLQLIWILLIAFIAISLLGIMNREDLVEILMSLQAKNQS